MKKFKELPLTPLRDIINKEYDYQHHAFCKGTIISYNNLFNYQYEVGENYIFVKQRMKDSLFILGNIYDFDYSKFNQASKRKLWVYSEEPTLFKNKIKEIYYDLEEVFNLLKKGKQTRRAINFYEKYFEKESDIRVEDTHNIDEVDEIYEYWKGRKQANKKVFQITFSPTRYRRAFSLLTQNGLRMYSKEFYIGGIPYGTIIYEIKNEYAFELAFISKYEDKTIKKINDINSLIILSTFYDLYKNYNVKYINVGPSAGIKSLHFFKTKIPFKIKKLSCQTIP